MGNVTFIMLSSHMHTDLFANYIISSELFVNFFTKTLFFLCLLPLLVQEKILTFLLSLLLSHFYFLTLLLEFLLMVLIFFFFTKNINCCSI